MVLFLMPDPFLSLVAVTGTAALLGCLWALWEGLRTFRVLADTMLAIRMSLSEPTATYDSDAFARLEAKVGLLPMTWEKVLDELGEQAEKAYRERSRIDKIWGSAKKRLEKSSEGDAGLEAELDSAGVSYEIGGGADGVLELPSGLAVGLKPASAYKWGA